MLYVSIIKGENIFIMLSVFMRYCIYNYRPCCSVIKYNNSLICLEVEAGITTRSGFKHFNLTSSHSRH